MEVTELKSPVEKKPSTKQVDLAAAIRAQAASSAIFKDVCTLFAVRQRSRSQVTVASLKASLMNEGFKVTRTQVINVLTFLAKYNVGRLKYDSKGVIALTDIKVSLQSIGKAAIEQGNIEKQKPQVKFVKLPAIDFQEPVKEPAHKIKVTPRRYTASLVVTIDNETITFDIPNRLTMKELAELLSKFYESDKK